MTKREAITNAARAVAPLFAHHGWTWSTLGAKDQVPTEADIALSFADMIAKMEKDPEINYILCGRLGVHRNPQEEGWREAIRLTLDLEEYAAEARR